MIRWLPGPLRRLCYRRQLTTADPAALRALAQLRAALDKTQVCMFDDLQYRPGRSR